MPGLLTIPVRPPLRVRPRPAVSVWAGPVVVVAVVLFNAAYVANWCPHDLAPDEAHYWDWSRHPDWGYYSKGPLIAWLIRAGCWLFGETPLGVRSVAVACGGLLLAGLWRLTLNCTGSARAALLVLLVAAAHPAVAVVGVLSTIDGPFLACWAWAMVAAHRKRWVAAGLLVAVGTLAKPTTLLFPACVLLVALFRPEWRTWRLWLFFPFAAAGLFVLALWNAVHDWVSVRHLFGHAGNGGEPVAWYSPLAFVGGQIALLLGGWFVAWLLAVWRFRPTTGMNACATDSTTAFLWWLSVPVFTAFLLASVRTAGEPNWPAAAYLGGAVLVAKWVGEQAGGRWRWLVTWVLPLTVGVGLVSSVLVRWPDLVRPSLAALLPTPAENAAPPIRRVDPTARLAGWQTLAKAVDEVRADLDDPVIVTMAWTVPGELGFYCDGHPPVYSFGSAVGDRVSQYDLWRPNPVADAQAFAGRTFVYVGDRLPDGVFDRIEQVRQVTHEEGGVPLASWTVWVGRGYRGFDATGTGKPTRY